ncbi:MAG: carbohydrate ABC transporter permease [Desulfurococcaceae archaeon]
MTERIRNIKVMIFVGTVLTLYLLWVLIPLLWASLNSFKTLKDIYAVPPKIIFEPTLENWDYVIRYAEFLRYYANTMIIGLTSTSIAMLLGYFMAYALARFEIRGRDNIAFFVLSQRILPPASIIIPLFIIFDKLGMINTYPAVILPYIVLNLPFSVWILRSFIEDIPKEIEEAALVDGASILRVMFQITFPQLSYGFIATWIFILGLTINEYFLAAILTGAATRPVSVAVTLFLPVGVRGAMPGPACAAGILMLIPPLLIFGLFHKFLIKGLTFGVVKG